MIRSASQLDSFPLENQLFNSLPLATRVRWQPQLELVNLRVGQVLSESGVTPGYAYFPTTTIVSLMCTMKDGASTETAVVGNEGMVGISLVMGVDTSTSEAVVHNAGQAYRLRSTALTSALALGNEILSPLLRYSLAVIAQVSQTAACNRHHSIEQQFCRRMLLALDRSPSNELHMTQELVSSLLGVRREGVTVAALRLQSAGVIRYRRGHITVLDRRGLEQRTCECYSSAKTEADRLFPAQTPEPIRHQLAAA